MATISPISVTFSCWPPKIFHNQPVSVQNLLSSSGYRFPQAELPLAVFGQGLRLRMIFQSEMAGLNDALGIPIAAGALTRFSAGFSVR